MKIVKLLSFIAVLTFVGCGDQADVKNETKEDAKVTLSVTCEGNLEDCGRMVMSLASAGYPVGTTMTTTIDGVSGTVFNANYGSAPTQQTYSLTNGNYRVTGTRVYPPATTFSTRSLVQVQTVPVDFVINAPNTTKINIVVAMLDADGDGRHDYSDPNPNNPCIPNNTVSACVNSNGGTVGTGVTGNDSDGDGCENSLDPQPTNPSVGCGGSPATIPTGVSYAWWSKTEAETWKYNTGSSPLTISDTTLKHWTIMMSAGSPIAGAHYNQLIQDDGPMTLGDNRNLSGKMQCANNGTVYLEVEDPRDYTSAANMYYPVTVTSSVAVSFSVNYQVTKTIPNRRTTIKTGLLPQGTICYLWYLRDKKLP